MTDIIHGKVSNQQFIGEQMELLAPAGGPAALRAAVFNGADAVYLGAGELNARRKAENFSLEDLGKWADFAHFFKVKVYLALNVLIKGREMREAAETALTAHEKGVDAFIIQDVGLLSALSKIAPGLRLHASTQMGVHNACGARFALENGAKRVILSRETTLQDIREIAKIPGLETEVFVHGAHCVSFSGNCYYSALVSKNSGNRGACMQLCRKKYTAESGAAGQNAGYTVGRAAGASDGYFLSPRDLCLAGRLSELRGAGVTAVKIEGRLKRPEYTAETTAVYRRVLDGMEVAAEDRERLGLIYNRGGFSEGFLDSRSPALINPLLPGHNGVLSGTVEKITGRGKCLVRAVRRLSYGDGFKILRAGEEAGSARTPKLVSGNLYELEYRDGGETSADAEQDARIGRGTRPDGDTCRSVQKGDLLYCTTSEEQLNSAAAREKRLPVKFLYTLIPGENATLCVEHDGVSARFDSGYTVERALNSETTRQEIEENAKKLGGTAFSSESVEINAPEPVFVPKSIQNALRRGALDTLENALSERYRKENLPDIDTKAALLRFSEIEKAVGAGRANEERESVGNAHGFQAGARTNAARGAIVRNPAQIPALKNDYGFFILNPDDYRNIPDPDGFSEKYGLLGTTEIYLNLPVFASGADIALFEGQIGKIKKYSGIAANNVYALSFAKTHGLKLIAGVGLNISNDFFDYAAEKRVFSPEYPAGAKKTDFLYSRGHFPLLSTLHCPYKAIFPDIRAASENKGTLCPKNSVCGFPLTLKDDKGKRLLIRKVMASGCLFELRDSDAETLLRAAGKRNGGILDDYTVRI